MLSASLPPLPLLSSREHTALWRLEGGMQVQRAVLCCCHARDSVDATAAASSSAASASALPPGRIELWSDEALASGVELTEYPLAHHQPRCRAVLVKSALVVNGCDPSSLLSPESVTPKLRYESVILDKLRPFEHAPCSGQPPSSPFAAAAAVAASAPPSPSSACADDLRPHLRTQPWAALVLPDLGGELLLQFMLEHSQASASATPPQSASASKESPGRSSPRTPDTSRPASALSFSASTMSPLPSSMRSGRRLSGPGGEMSFPPIQSPTVASIQAALRATLAIALELQRMHLSGVVHKSLDPTTVLLNAATGRVQFLDLSYASILSKDRAEPDLNLSLHSARSWLYASPEQSGKANRAIDARSDLYSLGCLAQQLITGRPPFVAHDPLETIHMHLAKAPPPIKIQPSSSTPDALLQPLLRCVQQIVSKLLQKDAQERYQSAAGLIHDLMEVLLCAEHWPREVSLPATPHCAPRSAVSSTAAASAPTSPTLSVSTLITSLASPTATTAAAPAMRQASLQSFVAGQLDDVSTFRLSQRLYGREKQVQQLRAAYDSITRIPTVSVKSNMAGGTVIVQPNRMSPHLFLLSGYSGVGKTSLVDELHQSILRSHGLFARGKFDLYKRDSTCLLSAFRALMLQLLVRDPALWKLRILRALGSNVAVLTDVLPELSRLVGEQPAIVPLGTAETASRFNMCFAQFVLALSTPSSPLVLFLDDLQWADSGSLSLLRLIINLDNAHLLIIGAYRDNEVDDAHPLTKLITDVRDLAEERSNAVDCDSAPDEAAGERFTEVSLQPLSVQHVSQLLQDSFHCSSEYALPLAQMLTSRTQGNPFFVSQLLSSYYASKLLWFDFSASAWRWNLEAILLTPVVEDVVDLVCRRMLSLSTDSQQLLQYASCSGSRLPLHALYLITQLPVGRLCRGVVELEQAGMLLCIEHSHDLLLLAQAYSTDGGDESASSAAAEQQSDSAGAVPSMESRLSSIILQFAHDKIQAAAYKLIPAGEVSRVHCTIATQLMKSYDEAEIEEYAIDIVGHINIGWLQLDSEAKADMSASAQDASCTFAAGPHVSWAAFFAEPNMLQRVIELEVIAGKAARASSAYDSALAFFTAALQLLQRVTHGESAATQGNALVALATPSEFLRVDGECWRHASASCQQVYSELAQCLFLLGQMRTAQQCVEYALSHIEAIEDRASWFELHVQTFTQQQMLAQAEVCGLAHLKEIGIELLPALTDDLKAWAFAVPDIRDESTYSSHPVLSQEPMSDQMDILRMQVMSALVPAMFVLPSPSFYSLVLTMLEHSRTKGSSPDTAAALNCLGVCLWPQPVAFAVGRVGQLLLESFGEVGRSALPRMNTVFWGFVAPWRKPLREVYASEAAALEEAFALGEVEWSSWMLTHMGWLTFISGSFDLPTTIAKQRAHLAVAVQRKMAWAELSLRIWLALAEELHSGVETPHSLGAFVELEDEHPRPIAPLFQFCIGLVDGIRAFLMRRLSAANEIFATKVHPLKHSSMSIPMMSTCVFYECLAILGDAPKFTCVSAPTTVALILEGGSTLPTVMPAGYDAKDVLRRLAHADALIAQMGVFASNNPRDHLHKLMAMQAERHRVAMFSHLQCHHLAINAHQLYAAAADHSLGAKMPLEAGIIAELTARFLLDCMERSAARTLLLWSHALFTQVGAKLKATQLHREFPQALAQASTPSTSSFPSLHNYGAPASVRGTPSMTTRSPGTSSGYPSVQSGSITSPAMLRRSVSTMVPLPAAALNPPATGASASTAPSTPSMRSEALSVSDASSDAMKDRSDLPDVSRSPAMEPSSMEALSVLKATASFSVEKDQSTLLKRLMRIVLETAGATRGVLVLEDSNKEWAVELGGSVEAAEGGDAKDDEDDKRNRTRTGEDRSGLDEAPALEPSPAPTQVSTTATAGMSLGSSFFSPVPSLAHLTIAEGPGSASASDSGQSSSTADSGISPSQSLRVRLRRGGGGGSKQHGAVSVEDALPASIFNYVLASMETLLLSDPAKQTAGDSGGYSAFSSDPYFESHKPRALLCMPVLRAGSVFGVLYLENDYRSATFTSSHIQLLQLLCGQAALSIDNARLYAALSENNAQLERQVHARTAELEEKNRQLITAKEVAEAATKTKADFLSNMSHEIRTPMNAVLGIGRLLADTSLTLEQQQYVQMINNSGHLLLTIINDILDFSKIEAGQLVLNFSSHNLSDVVESAVLLCYDMAVSKGLHLTWFVDPSLPPSLMIDSTRLQQILLNLLSNAIKFTRTGGVDIEVTGRALHAADPRFSSPHTKANRMELRCTVRDTGIGISPAQLAKLFRSFSQVQHVSGEFGGTGLGLVISKRLVEAMSGDIDVTTDIGKGSSFSFRILADVSAATPMSMQTAHRHLQQPIGSSNVSPGALTTTRPSSTVPGFAAPYQSPAQSTRTLLRGLPTSAVDLQGLTKSEASQLSRLRLIHVSEPTPVISAWRRLCEFYRIETHICNTPEEARTLLQMQAAQEKAAAPPVSLQQTTIVIASLESPGVTEEACMDRLSTLMPLRILYTYSHTKGSHATMDGAIAASAGVIIPAGSSSSSSSSLTVPQAQSDSSPMTPMSHSIVGWPADAAVPHHPVIRRGMRKPIKIKLLLRTLLTLMSEPFPTASSSPDEIAPVVIATSRPASPAADSGAAGGAAANAASAAAGVVSPIGGTVSVPADLVQRSGVRPSRIVNIAAKHPLRILLAEDNAINVKMMVMLLRKLGYEILVASNGVEALEILDREAARGPAHELQVILMDASMDVMDGMECTRVIRAQQLPSRTRPFIIAQTANVTEEYQQRCLDSGMDYFLTKPVHVEDLVRALKTASQAHQRTNHAHTKAASSIPANGPAPASSASPAPVSASAQVAAAADAAAAAASPAPSAVSASSSSSSPSPPPPPTAMANDPPASPQA